jgi:hypothetical protein
MGNKLGLEEAEFSVSWPSQHKALSCNYSSTVKIGRSTSAGSGFVSSEAELRREFEHFLLDLKLHGAFAKKERIE